MRDEGSITRWVWDLKRGDGDAARSLWDRFFHRMKGLARSRGTIQAAGGFYDEEDIALSAFACFCKALEDGHFPDLQGRDELWRLLAKITLRKGQERAREAQALKRGGFAAPSSENEPPLSVDDLPSSQPGPDFLVMMTEECQRLLGLLGNQDLERVALLRLEGYTNDEMAELLGCARRTVQRSIALIRQLWTSSERTSLV